MTCPRSHTGDGQSWGSNPGSLVLASTLRLGAATLPTPAHSFNNHSDLHEVLLPVRPEDVGVWEAGSAPVLLELTVWWGA